MRSLDGDVDDADVLVRFVRLGVDFEVGDPLHRLHALGAPPKHRVLVVQPRLRDTTPGPHVSLFTRREDVRGRSQQGPRQMGR